MNRPGVPLGIKRSIRKFFGTFKDRAGIKTRSNDERQNLLQTLGSLFNISLQFEVMHW